MKKILYLFLLLLPVLGFAQSRYGVEGVPMCWTAALGVDSSIVRYVLVSTTGKPVQTIVYENANGAVVTVSGGTLKYGFCDCAGGGALDSLGNGSVTWAKLSDPVKDSIKQKRDTFITVPPSTNYFQNTILNPARLYNNIYLSCKGRTDTSVVAFLAAPVFEEQKGVVYHIKNDSGLVAAFVINYFHLSNNKRFYLLKRGQTAQVRLLPDAANPGQYGWAVNVVWDSTGGDGNGIISALPLGNLTINSNDHKLVLRRGTITPLLDDYVIAIPSPFDTLVRKGLLPPPRQNWGSRGTATIIGGDFTQDTSKYRGDIDGSVFIGTPYSGSGFIEGGWNAYFDVGIGYGVKMFQNVPKRVVIGALSQSLGADVTAIGFNTRSNSQGVTVGSESQSAANGVALGYGSRALGTVSAAIGFKTRANQVRSLALGHSIYSNKSNLFVYGNGDGDGLGLPTATHQFFGKKFMVGDDSSFVHDPTQDTSFFKGRLRTDQLLVKDTIIRTENLSPYRFLYSKAGLRLGNRGDGIASIDFYSNKYYSQTSTFSIADFSGNELQFCANGCANALFRLFPNGDFVFNNLRYQSNTLSLIPSGDIRVHNLYILPKSAPSSANNARSVMLWTGNGTDAVPSFSSLPTGSTSIILNGSSFERAALTGDVTAAQNSNTLTIANGVVTAAKLNQMGATSGQVLTWNGTGWAPANVITYGVINGTTASWDLSLSQSGELTLTANRTLTVANPTAGSVYILKIIQDATGNRTLTWPATFRWPSGTVGVLSTAANAVDILTIFWDGTTYSAILTKDFK